MTTVQYITCTVNLEIFFVIKIFSQSMIATILRKHLCTINMNMVRGRKFFNMKICHTKVS